MKEEVTDLNNIRGNYFFKDGVSSGNEADSEGEDEQVRSINLEQGLNIFNHMCLGQKKIFLAHQVSRKAFLMAIMNHLMKFRLGILNGGNI